MSMLGGLRYEIGIGIVVTRLPTFWTPSFTSAQKILKVPLKGGVRTYKLDFEINHSYQAKPHCAAETELKLAR
jgi:hypothetical protein